MKYQTLLWQFCFPEGYPHLRNVTIQKYILLIKGTLAKWLVSLFLFGSLLKIDGLPKYPKDYDNGYWGKSSNLFSGFSLYLKLCRRFREKLNKFNKNLHFGRACYFCRGPPDCRCFLPPFTTITGGNYV